MHQKSLIDLKSPFFFSDAEFEMLSNILSFLLPIKLTVEAICRQDATLLSADAAIQFMMKSITGHPCSLISSVLQYLHDADSNKNPSDDETDRDYELFPIITKAAIAKVIVSQIQCLGVANLHYEAAPLATASTSANNVIDTNIIFNVDDDEVDQRNEISMTLKEKLEIAISKKICTRLPESGIDRNKKDLTRSIKKKCHFLRQMA